MSGATLGGRIRPARGRFAPSTTGGVHPGTLLAGLLCWLDARSRGAEVWLRLEDLDRERTREGYVEAMRRDLAWFGLEWDAESLQSSHHDRHEAALEALVAAGRVYACDCSRATIRQEGVRAPDGSFRYPGTCRAQVVQPSSWRTTDRPLRLRLESAFVPLLDESGLDLSGDAAALFGDPILRRRDGAFAYHFASVVDDAASGVGRVVRGRDLAPSTILQVALQRALSLPTPTYRHHGLFLERDGEKLSKLHGAVDVATLRRHYAAEALCGLLAGFVGLLPAGEACRPADLVAGFDWARVSSVDVELHWDEGQGLRAAATSDRDRSRPPAGAC
ncbi:MAG: glutamate--tRNA ligase family protein [Myxococcota bacterium]